MGPALLACLVLGVLALASPAAATTYEVGPGKPYATIEDVDDLLGPGDVVLVQGGHTYPGGVWLQEDGAAGNPITIRGVRVGGSRPVLSGGTNTIELMGDHTVLEGFDVTGGSFRCIYLHADDLLVRDTVVHDCPAHGILGADTDSGSATLDHVEVSHSGNGTGQHSIYVATDEQAHPGSVFRMRNCWVHDPTGGNLVKSRAERNEISYNWLEGNASSYHELELIGPDPGGGVPDTGAREDSEVVGNVLVHHRTDFTAATRPGGDATGESAGRYRFVSNTFVGPAGARLLVFRAFDAIESIEATDNVMYGPGGLQVLREAEANWVGGTRRIGGRNNWMSTGADVPPGFEGTVMGDEPGFADLAAGDLRPAPGSPLIDAGSPPAPTATGLPAFASAIPAPLFEPPLHTIGAAAPRPDDAALDIGAYEVPDPAAGGGPGGGSGGTGGHGLRRARIIGMRVKRTRRGLVLVVRLSADARVRGRVERRRRAVRRLKARSLHAGRRRIRLGRLARGRYRVRVSARFQGGQVGRASLRFRVRR
jgi:hypothetical protein